MGQSYIVTPPPYQPPNNPVGTNPAPHDHISVTGESQQTLMGVLRDMGFTDERSNALALQKAGGNVLLAIQILIGEEGKGEMDWRK